MKPDSLYNMGMLPLMHSEQQMRSKGIGWVRSGYDVCYGPNSIRHGKQTYFTLSFAMEFPHSDDMIHLAHCYPYSYTDLQNHLYMIFKVGWKDRQPLNAERCKRCLFDFGVWCNQLAGPLLFLPWMTGVVCVCVCLLFQEPSSNIVLQRLCLATSLAGNAVDVLTITAPDGSGRAWSQRQGVVLSGASCQAGKGASARQPCDVHTAASLPVKIFVTGCHLCLQFLECSCPICIGRALALSSRLVV